MKISLYVIGFLYNKTKHIFYISSKHIKDKNHDLKINTSFLFYSSAAKISVWGPGT